MEIWYYDYEDIYLIMFQIILSNLKFNVRVNEYLSDVHKLEMSVPQGSILSLTIFGLKLNSIAKCISPGIDNFWICYLPFQKHANYRKANAAMFN